MKIYTVVVSSDGGYGEYSTREISYLKKEDAEKYFNRVKKNNIYGSTYNNECIFDITKDEGFTIEYNDKSQKWHYRMWITASEVHESFSDNDYAE